MASLPQSQTIPMHLPGSLVRWWPVACGLALMYVPTWYDLAQGLWKEEPYAHGPLVLGVVAWLVWRARHVLAGELDRSAPVAGSLMRTYRSPPTEERVWVGAIRSAQAELMGRGRQTSRWHRQVVPV